MYLGSSPLLSHKGGNGGSLKDMAAYLKTVIRKLHIFNFDKLGLNEK